jgi:cell division protein FtsZ
VGNASAGRPTAGSSAAPSRSSDYQPASARSGYQPMNQSERPSPAPAPRQPRQVQFDDDDLDVPDFLK